MTETVGVEVDRLDAEKNIFQTPSPLRQIPFHRHDLSEAEIQSVVQTLRSDWITSGPRVLEFERLFGEAVGARFALAVNSCTAALHLALDAIGLKEGDEVLVPTMTFAATAEAVLYFKARPVLVDVNPQTQHIDLEDAARKISAKTRAIMPVHVAGLPCDMPTIRDFAQKFHLTVVEDAAHAFPAKSHGQWIGQISEATCFSFYATKTMTTGEGGMLTTNDPKVAERVRMMRIHGLSRDAWGRSASADSWRYDIVEPGFKYNLTDIAAAIGIPQLARAHSLREARARIAMKYQKAFAGLPGVMLPPEKSSSEPSADDLHAWHLYTLRLEKERLQIHRDSLLRELKSRGVTCSVHWIPLHLHSLYRERLGWRPEDLPRGTWLADRIFSLPLYPSMSEDEVGYVIETVSEVVRSHLLRTPSCRIQ